jgi:hypothetical protein
MANTKVTVRGISIGTTLVIVFIVLKLCNVIDWAWIWVFSPWWICVAFWLAIIVLGLIVSGIGALVAYLINK